MGTTRVIIYISAEFDRAASEAACLDYCGRRRYHVAGLVIATPAEDRWTDGVVAMLRAGTADIIVVPHHGHLPPQRMPRIESAADDRAVTRRNPRPGPVDR